MKTWTTTIRIIIVCAVGGCALGAVTNQATVNPAPSAKRVPAGAPTQSGTPAPPGMPTLLGATVPHGTPSLASVPTGANPGVPPSGGAVPTQPVDPNMIPLQRSPAYPGTVGPGNSVRQAGTAAKTTNGTPPFTNTTPPFTNVLPPFANTIPPLTNKLPPFTNVTQPFTNTIPPFTNTVPRSTNLTR
jgi:hypothetical protein